MLYRIHLFYVMYPNKKGSWETMIYFMLTYGILSISP